MIAFITHHATSLFLSSTVFDPLLTNSIFISDVTVWDFEFGSGSVFFCGIVLLHFNRLNHWAKTNAIILLHNHVNLDLWKVQPVFR